jgi:hypothetical protein
MRTDEKGHEPRDLNTRLVGWVALGMAGLGVVMLVGLWGLQAWFRAAGGRGAPIVGEPPVWVGERGLKERYLAAKTRELATYRWVDRQAGTVQLPIERAMALVVARGIRWNLASPPPGRQEDRP